MILKLGTLLFFEKAVVKLLLAMGYDGKEELFEHTRKPHDGGIDGVIKQDPLGIQKIYIQAKRYANDNSISSKESQSFSGALQGQGVERVYLLPLQLLLNQPQNLFKNY